MRFPRLPLLLIPALLALALAVAGCGGGCGGTTEATEPEEKPEAKSALTKAEFISQGNDLCGETNSAVGSVTASASETQSQTTQIAGLYIGVVEGLKKLGRPQETEGYAEFMEAGEGLAKVEGELKLAAEREDVETLETASQEAVPALEEFQSQAAIYGFADCSEGPHAVEASPEENSPETAEEEIQEETGGIEEPAPEESIEEVAPEEEVIPEEEEVEEVAPETGGAGGEIEEVAPEEAAPEEGSESGGVGPG
jgi:hypothetical protein